MEAGRPAPPVCIFRLPTYIFQREGRAAYEGKHGRDDIAAGANTDFDRVDSRLHLRKEVVGHHLIVRAAHGVISGLLDDGNRDETKA